MPMSPGGRFGWEEAAKVMVSVSCGHVLLDPYRHDTSKKGGNAPQGLPYGLLRHNCR